MTPIAGTLFHFVQSVEQGLPIKVDDKGNWGKDSYWHHHLVRICRGSSALTDPLIKAFNSVLDQLEYYHSESINPYIEKAEVMRKACSSSTLVGELDRRIYALRARNWDREQTVDNPDDTLFDSARAWKERQPYFRSSDLNAKQRGWIQYVARYPQFSSILKENSAVFEKFMVWSVRDQNHPEFFIHYPHFADKIMSVDFSKRVGFDKLIRMDEQSAYLRCKGKELDLRDPRASVALKHNLRVTFDSICASFDARKYAFGDLDSNEWGVFNWADRELGSYNPGTKSYERIDLDKAEWWKQLPREDVLNPIELQTRLGLKDKPDGISWYFSVVAASASNRELLIVGTHGCLLVSIPQVDGFYNLYSFGKYTYEDFPRTIRRLAEVSMQVLPARIISPDGTARETNRDKEYLTVAVSPAQGMQKMEEIKADIKLGLSGHLIFQLFSSNCMDWALEKIHSLLNDRKLYEACYVKAFEAEVSGFMGVAFRIYRFFPRVFSRIVLNSVAWIFGGYETIIEKTRDGATRARRFIDHTPWHPTNNKSASPSVMLILQREGAAANFTL